MSTQKNYIRLYYSPENILELPKFMQHYTRFP